jgi:hypothetical protein
MIDMARSTSSLAGDDTPAPKAPIARAPQSVRTFLKAPRGDPWQAP